MSLEHRRVVWAYPEAQPGTCRGCGQPCDVGSRAHPDCRDRHREMADHRGSMFERHGGHPVCVDRRRRGLGRCQGKIESDHVEALADGGDKAWTVPRCKRHHDMKTQRDARARRGRGAPMSKSTKPQPESTSTNWWAVAIAVVLLASGVALVLGHTTLAIAIPTGAVVLVIAAAVGAAALARRTDRRERLAHSIAREMKAAPERVKVRVHGAAGSAQYPVTSLDVPGSPWCRAIEDVISAKVGTALTFTWHPHTDRVEWAPRADGDPEPTLTTTSDPGGVQARVHDALTAVIKGESALTVVGQPDAVGPLAMRLAYPASLRDDSDDVRAAIVSIVNHKAPGRWRATWDTEGNRVLFERRPPMPPVIAHEASVFTDQDRLPFATGEDHETITWDLKRSPHALVAGETGSGKTVLLRNLVTEAAARGFEIVICDPKRVEMRGFRDWPNVTAVATSTEDMIALVDTIHALMDQRYVEIEDDPSAEDRLHPILLVIDEAREWIDRVNASWRADLGRTGGEHPTIERWRSIARLGRSARIHMLVGIQRPDAKVFGGEARDNYGARMALGSLSEQGARMMFGVSDVGRDVPDDAKGRATVDLGGIREVQVWWTPDPRNHAPEDEPLLDALRPAKALYPARDLDAARLPHHRPAKGNGKGRAAPGWRRRPAESVDHEEHIRHDGVEADVIENLDDPTDPDTVRLTVRLADGSEEVWPLDRTDSVEVPAV